MKIPKSIIVIVPILLAMSWPAQGENFALTENGRVPGQPFEALQQQIDLLQQQVAMLQARLAADDFRATSDGQMVLPLRVVLPVALVSFIPEGDQLMGSVLIKILSRDLATGASAIAERPFKIKHQPTGGGEWMQLPVELQLAPGSHVLAIGVLDQISGMTSLVSTTLDVPSP